MRARSTFYSATTLMLPVSCMSSRSGALRSIRLAGRILLSTLMSIKVRSGLGSSYTYKIRSMS